MIKEKFKLSATNLCTACLMFFLASCSGYLEDVTPRAQTDDKSIQDLVSLSFDKDNVQLDANAIQSTEMYEKNYKLLANGDYEFTYTWSFQTAKVVVHNTERCQFGDPSEPSLKFCHHDDNVYEGKLKVELTYVLEGVIKTSVLRGSFSAVTAN